MDATYKHIVNMLMEGRFPEDEMILDDDIIVLTKVDIGEEKDHEEIDECDEKCELRNIYEDEDSDMENDGIDLDDGADLIDFIDDRPESELENSSGYDDDSDEDSKYNSLPEIDSDRSSDETDEDEENSDNESNSTAKQCNGDSDDDDDDNIRPSPRKRARLYSSSDSETDDIGFNSVGDFNAITISNGSTHKHVNKFGVYLLPKIERKSVCLRYYGRIGMKGIMGYCRTMTKRQFCDLIGKKRLRDGFTRLNLMYLNARHMEYRKPESDLEPPVRKLLIHLIDRWFPLGIPLELHVNRAENLLECIKTEIENGKVPHVKYSNKFYELIPHQGDDRRRKRFTDLQYCNSKLKFVEKIQTAIKCFDKVQNYRGKNPLDCFMEEWLRIELKSLSKNDTVYKVLTKVVKNTKHSSQCYKIGNIFQVDNMNPELNGDFSTNITTNHRYLIHFTFASNLLSILREGLVPAPEHIHSVNRFFGEGIYFWDAIANAGLNYKSLDIVYILVCRVALGNTQKVNPQYLRHNETMDWKEGFDSLYCPGKIYPSSRNAEEDLRGAKIYCGKLPNLNHNITGNPNEFYNKYIVRNKNQVSVEYILKLVKEN